MERDGRTAKGSEVELMTAGPEFIIGVDLGGTEIKSVAVDPGTGETLRRATLPTRDGDVVKECGRPIFVQNVSEMVAEHEASLGGEARAIGLSAPGLPTPVGDAIGFMPGRMFGLEGTVWRSVLGREERVPVINDAQAALLGEIWLGAATGLDDVVMFTLGTGVGGAIFSGGQLLKGRYGRAGHLGHMSVDFRGAPDLCNTPGSIEDAIGEVTLKERSEGAFTSTESLVAAYEEGDDLAAKVWVESLEALAAAIVSIANAVDPEVVVLGGGITSAGEKNLFAPLRTLVEKREWRPADAHIELRQAQLGTWAGAYGAAFHAKRSRLEQGTLTLSATKKGS